MNIMKYREGYRNLVVGVDVKVPLMDGSFVTGINFDNAATTPPFVSVLQEIIEFAPWYSSIHRGTGFKSKISSSVFEISRQIIAKFVGADLKHDTLIFVKNTTEAINKAANRLLADSGDCVILSTGMEHHSNDLPWRGKYNVDYIPTDATGRLSLDALKSMLIKYKGSVGLVAITGASNVTGYINPIHRVAALAHQYKARILVDGAQLVPHAPVSMKPFNSPEHIDFLVFSGHKMYAPFGTGVLIGPKSVFDKGAPDYSGGGTVDIVTHDWIKWAGIPHKDEAGTPNLMGAVALSAAIRTLEALDMKNVEAHERELTRYALERLADIPHIRLYGDPKDSSHRVSIIPFNVDGLPHDMVAAILSCEAGIAVRSGCFCAQPYVQKLLSIPPEEVKKRAQSGTSRHPGMVRISFGLYNTYGEIDILTEKLKQISHQRNWYKNKYRPL